LKRLNATGGFFGSDRFREWLNGVFVNQLQKTGRAHEGNVTFQELFTATKIELNVVAADLSLQRHVIFSYLETPDCVVADAVVASSSIPFAFPSRLLRVPEPNGEKEGNFYHHTIVDGGVWSNFPLFVFEDRSFRQYYERKPEEIDRRRVIGFLLERGGEEEIPRGDQITFEWEVSDSNLRAREWRDDDKETLIQVKSVESSLSSPASLAWLLWPFAMLGRFVGYLEGGKVRGRWPRPHGRLNRYLVDIITGFQGGINGNVLFTVICAAICAGPVIFIYYSIKTPKLFGSMFSYFNGAESIDWSIVFLPLQMTLFLVTVALLVLAICVAVGILYVIHLLFRATRATLYGLVTTYFNAPGAPAWASKRENIVSLPIPPDVRTLTFNIAPLTRERLAEAAYQATIQKLDPLLLHANSAG